MTEQATEQTVEQALEEQAASFVFGDEPQSPGVEGEEAEVEQVEEAELTDEEEEAAEQLEEAAPEVFEFTIGEATYEVDQVLRDELEKAKDYTQKTQGVKQEWETAQVKMGELKALEADYKFAEEMQKEAQELAQMNWQIAQFKDYMKNNVDNLQYTDLEKIRIQIGQLEDSAKDVETTLATKWQDHQQAQEQARGELLNKSTDVLRQRIPKWDGEADKALKAYAVSAGYTEQEYDNVLDPRIKETLWKASQYDRVKQGATAAVQTVKKAPKIQSRNPMPKKTQDRLNLRKKLKSPNRSDADKAQLIGDSISIIPGG